MDAATKVSHESMTEETRKSYVKVGSFLRDAQVTFSKTLTPVQAQKELYGLLGQFDFLNNRRFVYLRNGLLVCHKL